MGGISDIEGGSGMRKRTREGMGRDEGGKWFDKSVGMGE